MTSRKKMTYTAKVHRSDMILRRKGTVSAWCFLVMPLIIASCGQPPGIGIGGHYSDGKLEIMRGGNRGDITKAIEKLEYVVQRDPFYRDSLTLLGRAYYQKARYQDALQILKRSLALNEKDEIAWLVVGLTQLRLSDDERGLESFKGGLTLLSKVSKDGYKGIEAWDVRRSVATAIRRAVLAVTKGLDDKRSIIREGDRLLDAIDSEEWQGRIEQQIERRSS